MADAVFAGGQARAGSSGTIGEVVNPADGAVLDSFALASADDVDRAAVGGGRLPGVGGATPVERSTG